MADLETSATPDTDAAATQATGPADGQGTVQSNGDAAGQSAPVEEGFTKLDPKTLPPELRKAYDSMLTDYKQKTTKVSETVKAEVAKATEALRQKAELYDQVAGRQDFVDKWNEYVRSTNGQQPQNQNDPVMEKLQAMEAKFQEREVAEVVDAFRDAVNDKGEKLNPEFDKLNDIVIGSTGQGDEYSLLRACIELAPAGDAPGKIAAGYKMAKQIHEQIFEEGKKAGMGQMRAKVQRSTEPPSGSSISMKVTDKRPKDAREAIDLANQGIAVQR